MYDNPEIVITGPVSNAAMSTPAMAGPMILAALIPMAFKATALVRLAGPTSSEDERLPHRAVE